MAGPVPAAGPHLGRVAAFDPRRGLGRVVADDGTAYDFHATAIADGSRTIALGAAVAFVVVAGHRGRHEAQAIVPAPSAG